MRTLAIVAIAGCARIVGIPDHGPNPDGGSVGGDAGTLPRPSPYAIAVLGDGPVAYYRLHETDGVTAVDATGHSNGTYLGNVMLGGPGAFPDAGTSVHFDGANAGVGLGTGFDFAEEQPFTLEAWIRPTFDGVFEEIGSRWKEPPHRAGYTWFTDGSAFGFERDIEDGSANEDLLVQDGVIGEGQWAYVVATYDGTTMTIYLDGHAESSIISSLSIPDPGLPAMIGAANGSQQASTFDGDIDEYAIYAYALTAVQVNAHYQAAIASN